MKRWTIVFALVLSMAASAAYAAHPQRRYHRGSYGVRVTYYSKGRPVASRFTYPGYANGFPPPAFLYYGYPQSGFSHGIGF